MDEWGIIMDDEWAKNEEICYNCKYMGYLDDGVALIEICTANDKLKFVTDVSYCDKFKNRWEE